MTQLPLQQQEEYLGDGLYISFDGYQIRLRAPRENGDHFVALEPKVFQSLIEWINQYPTLAQAYGQRLKYMTKQQIKRSYTSARIGLSEALTALVFDFGMDRGEALQYLDS